MKTNVIQVRPYNKDVDENFIYSTFLYGVYFGSPWYNKIHKYIFMPNYRKFLNNLLAHPNTKVKVAYLIEDPNILLGYNICNQDGSIIHWVYVKKEWRHLGIAKLLLDNAKVKSVTHLSELGESLLKKLDGAVFNPFEI